MTTTRLEAFSDGVIAIAITLLVLDLKVPEVGDGALWGALRAQWPAYLGYVTSFATIGIMWVNHHAMLHTLARVNRTLLFANLALLFGIATLPFTTSLAARWLRAGDDAHLAMALYCGSMVTIGVVFVAMWAYLGRHGELLRPGTAPAVPRRAARRSAVGPCAYLVALLVALVSAAGALVICTAVAAYFVLPVRPESEPERVLGSGPAALG